MAAVVDTDVLVVGGGPCGMTVASLLGLYGVRTVVVERDTEILQFPRAVGIDDESLRTYQTLGIVGELMSDMLQNTPIRYHTSWGRCFAHVKPSVQPFGWPRRNLFLQPLYESVLRRSLESVPTVDVRYGCELISFEQGPDFVVAQVQTPEGEAVVSCRFLVGADGGRSTVRGQAGIELTGSTAPDRWLVVDVEEDRLDAPYSAVYCDPVQPVLVVPLPYGHRRFEFKLGGGDTDDAASERAPELIRPFYQSVPMPKVLHSRVYWHHSRVASTFQAGRVFLVGDAAHLQPPFFGQGMNSGVRDATNLSWKLAAVVAGHAGVGMLGSYDAERRGHAREMVDFATRVGRMYSPRSLMTERLRDIGFRILQVVPGGKEYILQMKYKPMPRYRNGVVVVGDTGADDAVGRMFMQPVVESADRRRLKLDDAIGSGFAVLGLHLDPADQLSDESLDWWKALGATFVSVRAPRQGPRPAAAGRLEPLAPIRDGTTVVEDVDGAFRDWLLGRPGDEVLVLRPDRYLAAVCDRDHFEDVTGRLRRMMTVGAAIEEGSQLVG